MSDTTTAGDAIERMKSIFERRSPEELERRLREKSERDAQARDAQCAQLMSEAGVPKRHRCVRIDAAGQWGETLAKLKQMRGTGFIAALVGTRGNGKTQLAAELIRENAGDMLRSKFCCAMEFFMEIKATFRSEKLTEKDVIAAYQKPALLVLDEVGQRSETEWENRLLFHLVNQRYEDQKDTLFIANLEPEQLIAALGPSIASRMNETGGIINCTWPTFR